VLFVSWQFAAFLPLVLLGLRLIPPVVVAHLIGTVWIVGLFLFSPVHTRPFIYFQF